MTLPKCRNAFNKAKKNKREAEKKKGNRVASFWTRNWKWPSVGVAASVEMRSPLHQHLLIEDKLVPTAHGASMPVPSSSKG